MQNVKLVKDLNGVQEKANFQVLVDKFNFLLSQKRQVDYLYWLHATVKNSTFKNNY